MPDIVSQPQACSQPCLGTRLVLTHDWRLACSYDPTHTTPQAVARL